MTGAPCAGKTDPDTYGRAVSDVRLFLEGRDADLETTLEQRMRKASREREYEEAARLRNTLKTVRALAVRQRISSVGLEEQDYLAHHAEGEQVALVAGTSRDGRRVPLAPVAQDAGSAVAQRASSSGSTRWNATTVSVFRFRRRWNAGRILRP